VQPGALVGLLLRARQTLYNDWAKREEWIKDFVQMENAKQAIWEILNESEIAKAECWKAVNEAEEKGYRNAANGAMRNLLHAIEADAELKMNFGLLPKRALQVDMQTEKPACREDGLRIEQWNPQDREDWQKLLHLAIDIENKYKKSDSSKYQSIH
jgi:hypothetical protein